MNDTTTLTPKALAALRLADQVRASVRRRTVDLDASLLHFDDVMCDPAASVEDELEAAVVLMKAVERTDQDHRLRLADASAECSVVTRGRGEAG